MEPRPVDELPLLDPTADWTGLAAGIGELGTLLARDADVLLERRPDVSGWSAAEHAFHVTLADELCLKNVHSLLAGKGMLVRPLENRLPEALELLRRDSFPRGEAEAPRFVRPPKRIDLAFLGELLEGVRGLHAELEPHLASLPDTPLGVPHQVLGDLDACEWLRFAHVHTRHHVAIAGDVLA